MDVFVVVNQEISEPGVVVGAAADLDGAYAIADRLGSWPDGVDPRWIVDLDTGVHSRRWAGVWQEIVRVPLAGHIEIDWIETRPGQLPRAHVLQSEVQEIGRTWGAP